MITSDYNKFYNAIKAVIPSKRIILDELRRLAYGTDASFYRMIPRIVIKAETEEEIILINRSASAFNIPLTYRAAGTSLSGQAISDSVLVMIDSAWKGIKISADKSKISLQPGVLGSRANMELRQYSLKIGPDPASINSAMIGGIAANNASGMCCGTAQNSYNTVAGMKIIFADGTLLNTSDNESRKKFRDNNSDLIYRINSVSEKVKSDTGLSDRIRLKYKMKNTTGYSLNALIDFDDPIDIIEHLMIGSEGTLGFISEITYRTVPEPVNKASALLIFRNIFDACSAVPILKRTNVDAVEIMDRASLRSVEDKPGMPDYLNILDTEATALLVETSALSNEQLKNNINAIIDSLKEFHFVIQPEFTDVKSEYEKLWKIRKGLFPSVGAIRKSGTTVIIEDVCFPVDKLAEATTDLQKLFSKYGYDEAIIFGHSLEGNLHFVFSQDFNSDSEVTRYSNFMDEVVRLVVNKYDGSLKAEHGTGRNMAPFVKDEWGEEAYLMMIELKNIFDPKNILNPGVILNSDNKAHIKNLKPLPIANDLIDKCIECGFCEVNCPSRDLTLSPRQRITVWREIQRLILNKNDFSSANKLIDGYNYFGNQTCATDGLCKTSCPVNIDTGDLIKQLRAEKISYTANAVADFISNNMSIITSLGRTVLNALYFKNKILGDKFFETASAFLRWISFNKIPRWTKYLPKGSSHIKINEFGEDKEFKVVYFPSCITRTLGIAKDYDTGDDLPVVTERLLKKAGYQVIYPDNLDNLCCGMAFSSKGFVKQGRQKSDELISALTTASNNGEYPVLIDMSPCLYQTKKNIASKNDANNKLKVYDQVEFIHDFMMDKLNIKKTDDPIALHVTCSSTKMGLEEKLLKVAGLCSSNVIIPKDVGCCGFAGDRGFSFPELNESALKNLKNNLPENCKSGYSNSRTCEIGLSEQSGVNYKSVIYLVDKVSEKK